MSCWKLTRINGAPRATCPACADSRPGTPMVPTVSSTCYRCRTAAVLAVRS